MQDMVCPKEHCDDRVEILQADARELEVMGLFTKSEVCFSDPLEHARVLSQKAVLASLG